MKKVVGYTGVKQMVRMGREYEKNPGLDKEDIIKEQEKAPPEEKALWRERGAERKKSGGNTERTRWETGPNGSPDREEDHRGAWPSHVGVAQMEILLNTFPPLFLVICGTHT